MLLSAGRTVNNHSNRHNLSASLTQRLNSGQRRTTGRGGVLNSNHAATLNAGALHLTAHAVRLLSLTHHKRVNRTVLITSSTHNRGTHRVSTHSQAASSLKLDAVLIQQVQHDLTDQARSLVMQGDAAQVNVVVGFLAGGEDHVPAHHS